MKLRQYLNEGKNETISKIADVVKKSGKSLVDLRKPLESMFDKKAIDFVFSPVAHFRIEDKGKTIIVVSKKYADDAEEIVGKIAIGYDGKI